MSKNLRVFFLSVLVVIFAVSSAMAASLESIVIDAEGNDEYYSYSSDTLTIKKDGIYTFASSDITIGTLSFDDKISEVIIRLPKPDPAEPGNGTSGDWALDFASLVNDSDGTALSKTNRAKIKIEQADVHAAIITPTNGARWAIPATIDLTLDAPIRVNNDDRDTINFDVNVIGKMTFASNGQIYGNSNDVRIATGFTSGNSGKYTVSSDGEIVIQNQYAIIGSGLSTDVAGTLTIDIPDITTLNLRGITTITGTRESNNGAYIGINGGTIATPRALTLIGELHSTSGTVKKGGAGTLTLSHTGSGSSMYPNPALSGDVKLLQVTKGGLILSGEPSWITGDTAGVTVSDDASTFFTANGKSIKASLAESASFDIKVGDHSTATFKQHAIYQDNEIYPYEDFVNEHDGLYIRVRRVFAYVTKNATLVVDEGAFAVDNVSGSGTIQINNSDEEKVDKAVLILTSPDANTNGFTGTITGSANLGLYATRASDPSFTNKSLFPSADITLNNVIVYGPAVLSIDEEANLDNVSAIWLRGNRPGADNTNTKIANSKITVGALILANVNAAKIQGETAINTEYDSKFDLTDLNIKIDGTANAEARAKITLDKQVYATIGNLAFYVNRDLDFNGAYVKPADGIYALTIDGSAQPSKLVIDGTTVTGAGVSADVANTEKVYQVQMTASSDVRFTGNNGAEHHPIGENNSLFVGKDGKLEMARGAIIDGHLTFAGSTSPLSDSDQEYVSEGFPNENWFASGDNNWNALSLDSYSTFTTVVAKNNRVGSNTASEYAVKVAGDLMFSKDVTVTPSMTKYPGRVLVRVKTNTNAFDGVTDTTRQRFMAVGITGDGEYAGDFVTPYNATYLWRITPVTSSTKGAIVEARSEFALLSLGDFAFTSGASTFGHDDFVVKSDVTAWAKSEALSIAYNTNSDVTAKYVLSQGNENYYVKDAKVYFRKNVEGEEAGVDDNIFDEDQWSETYSTEFLNVGGEFRLADDGKSYVELRGKSFGAYDTDLEIPVMLTFTAVDSDDEGKNTLVIAGVIPGFKYAKLSAEGYGNKYSEAKTEALEPLTFTEGDDGIVSFTVEGLAKSQNTTTTTIELVNGKYVYNVQAVEGNYLIFNENKVYATVKNLRLVRFDGTNLSEAEETEVTTDPQIVTESDPAVISAPSSVLGNTGDGFVATKWLSLRGDKTDGSGTLTTGPVAYTLIKATKPEDIITETGSLNQTVQIGGKSVSGFYEIDLDAFSDDVTLIPVNLPAWLGYNGGGSVISYQTGDLTGVDPKAYTFRVIGNDGTTHKIYEFTVTVEGEPQPVEPHIEPAEDVTVNVLIGETNTAELTFVSGDSTVATWAIAENTNPAGLLTGSASGNTYTLTINAAGVAAGTYEYTVNANDGAYTRKVTVVVSEPTFEIEEVYNGFTYFSPVDGHTYYAVYSASGAAGTVEWTLTDNTRSSLRSYHSGDQFVVEGIAKLAQDSDEMDIDQTFRVVATSGNRTVDEPIETTFTVEAEDEDIAASATALTPAAGSHDAVDSTYVVNFPAGVTADVDSVHLPSWLEPVMGDTEDTADYVVGVKFSKVAGELPNGTEGTVFVEAYDDESGENVYYKWNVKYNAEPAKLELTLTPAALTVAVSADGTSKASVTNALGNVTYTLSKDAALTWVTVSGDVVTVSKPTTAGTYTVTVIAQDDRGVVGQATAALTITVTSGPTPISPDVSPDVPGEFTITPSRPTVTFTSPTDAAQTVTLSANLLGATVTYSATVSPATGLSADVSGSTLTLTPSAAGSYTVTVTGTNGERTATATINVTVGTTPVTTFTISANPSTLTFTSPAAADQEVTLSSNFLDATVTYTAEVTSGSEDGLDLDVSGSTLTVDALAAGSYVITVTGTNGERTATTTINVTVGTAPRVVGSSGGGGCDAGFGALALVLAAPLFLRRRRS